MLSGDWLGPALSQDLLGEPSVAPHQSWGVEVAVPGKQDPVKWVHLAEGRLKVCPFRCLPTQEGATYGRWGRLHPQSQAGSWRDGRSSRMMIIAAVITPVMCTHCVLYRHNALSA